MKTIKYLLLFFSIVMIGCHSQKIFYGEPDNSTTLVEDSYIYQNGPYVQLLDYVSDRISETIITSKELRSGDIPGVIRNIFGYRDGYIENGKQEGKWETYKYHKYDSLGYSRSKRYLGREEYFRKGLRDSIYKIYNKDGKIIYSTYFKNGNGIEKDFYDNGQLYYEIKTQNGYFTDTLRLYHENGRLAAKLLYDKDSLIFKKEYSKDISDTIENGRKVQIQYNGKLIQKKIYKDETWWYNKDGKVELKAKDSIVDGVKKSFQEYINEDHITKSVRINNNHNIEYEKIERWWGGKLNSRINVYLDKHGKAYELENSYDNGKIISCTKRLHKAYLFIKPNYIYETTDYYKNNKKYSWSELIYKEIKVEKSPIQTDKQITAKERNFYNLKNDLIKKEYIEETAGSSGGGCEAPIPFLITKIWKVEYYKNGKIIRTEVK